MCCDGGTEDDVNIWSEPDTVTLLLLLFLSFLLWPLRLPDTHAASVPLSFVYLSVSVSPSFSRWSTSVRHTAMEQRTRLSFCALYPRSFTLLDLVWALSRATRPRWISVFFSTNTHIYRLGSSCQGVCPCGVLCLFCLCVCISVLLWRVWKRRGVSPLIEVEAVVLWSCSLHWKAPNVTPL